MFNQSFDILNIITSTYEYAPHNIKGVYFGWVAMYPIFMTVGMVASVFGSYLRMKAKKVETEYLAWSVIPIIPAALFGASFFGKFNGIVGHPWVSEIGKIEFFSLFAFWEAGLSIHGGVIVGVLVGCLIFYFVSKKTKVSLWVYMDCIIPNILLGQVIGRWGNFFNHEVLGAVVDYDSLRWLPAIIRDNAFEMIGSSPEMIGGEIVYRHPIFLYESFFSFVLWVSITFGLPNIKYFGRKPWKNSKIKPSFGYSVKRFFNKKYHEENKMSFKEAWEKNYEYSSVNFDELLKS
ncbi:prolipoprotein diacylglyceryl transferase [Spiroplasma endosymbiont of Anurida maritima]|uniref:prolipoprotein diacylglyceryl transferase family protein n=1 Tax=Spiroplasma endosymbiont of Anurida maritima TaxID=2967972 RepID=UPI0036D33339